MEPGTITRTPQPRQRIQASRNTTTRTRSEHSARSTRLNSACSDPSLSRGATRICSLFSTTQAETRRTQSSASPRDTQSDSRKSLQRSSQRRTQVLRRHSHPPRPSRRQALTVPLRDPHAAAAAQRQEEHHHHADRAHPSEVVVPALEVDSVEAQAEVAAVESHRKQTDTLLRLRPRICPPLRLQPAPDPLGLRQSQSLLAQTKRCPRLPTGMPLLAVELSLRTKSQPLPQPQLQPPLQLQRYLSRNHPPLPPRSQPSGAGHRSHGQRRRPSHSPLHQQQRPPQPQPLLQLRRWRPSPSSSLPLKRRQRRLLQKRLLLDSQRR